MLQLIPASRQDFTDKKIQLKLYRRFWRALQAYHSGQTYEQVLKLFYSNLCSATIQSHRKISNTNLAVNN